MAKIGVKAKIVTYEWGEYLKRAKAGEHQTVMMGWTARSGCKDAVPASPTGQWRSRQPCPLLSAALWLFQDRNDSVRLGEDWRESQDCDL
jgi:ABC-type transport system substrate-binding protein